MHLLSGHEVNRALGGRREGDAVRYVLPIRGVALFELLENTDLDLACVSVLLYRANDLDGDTSACLLVDGLYDLAERTLTKQSNSAI